jgi:hypothetical protein
MPFVASRRLRFIVLIFLSSRIFYFLTSFLLAKANKIEFSEAIFCQYDCNWYLSIIENGYDTSLRTTGHTGAANWAFFPAFPMAVKLLSGLTNGNPLMIGILLNNLFFLFFLITSEKYLSRKFTNYDVNAYIFLYCFSPFSIYFNSLYTESLYILLIMLFILNLNRNRLVAGFIGTLLTAVRVTGITFFALSILSTAKTVIRRKKLEIRDVVGLVLFPLGLLIFSYYLYRSVGDPLAFITIQKAWGFGDLSFIDWLFDLPKVNSPVLWGYFFSILLSFLLSVFFFVRKNFTEAYILAMPVVISAISVAINFRYFFVLYPFYLFASQLIHTRKMIRLPLYVATILTLVFALNGWINAVGYLV